MPGSDSPDFAASKVLADVLNSQRAHLYSLVPEGKALSTEFSVESLPQTGFAFAIAAFPKGGDGKKVVDEVRDVLAKYRNQGFPAELVEAAKRREATDAEMRKNSVSGLAMAWSQAVAVEGKTSPEDDLRAIERVTPADVDRVARTYFTLDHAVTALLVPKASGAPVSAKAPGGRESLSAKEVKPATLPEWAEKRLSRLTVPQSTIHPTVATLPNGIKLIVQPEAVSRIVSVYGHIENNPDLETPPGQDGVGDLLSGLFNYGSQTLDRIAFQKALDDIGAHESAGTDFSLEVLNTQFQRGAELLADNELHPAMPAQAFNIIKTQVAAEVKGELDSPDYLTGRALHQLLFPPSDPTLRHPTPETVSARTLADVRNYLQRVYRPDLTTIVVIGDTTPERARAIIEKSFGAWKAEGPKPETTLPAVPRNEPGVTSVPDESRVQDSVTLAESIGLKRTDPDYYPLELGNHVLGGGFYATRLYRDLRENGGYVYTVSSTFEAGKSRGLYVVHYATDPKSVFTARTIVERDLAAMRKDPVTDRELTQAKAMALREIPLSESSEHRIASGLISRTTLGLPLDEPTIAARRYLAMNAAEIRDAFAKWIRVPDLVQVTEGPAPKP
jgi:zinc protease